LLLYVNNFVNYSSRKKLKLLDWMTNCIWGMKKQSRKIKERISLVDVNERISLAICTISSPTPIFLQLPGIEVLWSNCKNFRDLVPFRLAVALNLEFWQRFLKNYSSYKHPHEALRHYRTVTFICHVTIQKSLQTYIQKKSWM